MNLDEINCWICYDDHCHGDDHHIKLDIREFYFSHKSDGKLIEEVYHRDSDFSKDPPEFLAYIDLDYQLPDGRRVSVSTKIESVEISKLVDT